MSVQSHLVCSAYSIKSVNDLITTKHLTNFSILTTNFYRVNGTFGFQVSKVPSLIFQSFPKMSLKLFQLNQGSSQRGGDAEHPSQQKVIDIFFLHGSRVKNISPSRHNAIYLWFLELRSRPDQFSCYPLLALYLAPTTR